MKKCIFCDKSPPEVKITKEHVLPQWMKKSFPLSPDYAKNVLYVAETAGIDPVERNMIGLSPFEMKVSRVCDKCNNGWMSRKLEEPLKTTLEKLITFKSIVLNNEEKELLALWAVKTAAVRALLDTGENVIPDWFYKNIQSMSIPNGCTVYIVCRNESNENITSYYSRRRVGDCTLFLCTFEIKSLVLFVSWCDPEAEKKEDIEEVINELLTDGCAGASQKIFPPSNKESHWPFDEPIEFTPLLLNHYATNMLYTRFIDNKSPIIIIN
ncbi:hypothetical protein [Serratia plymuthica]|uniref:hypothetical protein n=1 Tax=Serratia plymuthica TaxID=82996 RepID=UPI00141A1AA3|nr:hypothetical protein [Serratia plymuthica]NIC26537.1 hypothetical protein [Serratia plymuthica]